MNSIEVTTVKFVYSNIRVTLAQDSILHWALLFSSIVPWSNVYSPLLFIIFLIELHSNHCCKFGLALTY